MPNRYRRVVQIHALIWLLVNCFYLQFQILWIEWYFPFLSDVIIETCRTRMVVGVGSKNIYGSFLQIIEQQGWQGLWAGNAINMLRIVPTQAIELGTFEYVKRAMTSAQEKWKQEESPTLQIGDMSFSFSLAWLSPIAVAGAAAGVVSTLACHPLEVLKVA